MNTMTHPPQPPRVENYRCSSSFSEDISLHLSPTMLTLISLCGSPSSEAFHSGGGSFLHLSCPTIKKFVSFNEIAHSSKLQGVQSPSTQSLLKHNPTIPGTDRVNLPYSLDYKYPFLGRKAVLYAILWSHSGPWLLQCNQGSKRHKKSHAIWHPNCLLGLYVDLQLCVQAMNINTAINIDDAIIYKVGCQVIFVILLSPHSSATREQNVSNNFHISMASHFLSMAEDQLIPAGG